MERERTYFILANLSTEDRRVIAEETKNSELLDELADDPEAYIRHTVAKNFRSAISTLERLKKYENEAVSKMAERTLSILLCG